MLLLEFALAWLVWAVFQPSPAEAKTLALGWVSQIWLRNLFLLTVVVVDVVDVSAVAVVALVVVVVVVVWIS